MSQSAPNFALNWTNDTLNALRHRGDPLADSVAAEMIRTGQIPAVNTALAWLENNDEALPVGLPTQLVELLQADVLPAWADPVRIRRAQECFAANGAAFGIALLFRSLPVLYCGNTGGAQTLAITGQLPTRFRRRAAETLRFIMDVLSPGGLEPSGRGLRSAQKVRLMHACIRNLAVKGRPGPPSAGEKGVPQTWNSAWGMPINQEEKLGTLLAFSTQAVDAMRRLDVPFDDEQAADLLHTWHVIGYLIGIEVEQMPADLAAAERLWQCIRRRNFGPSDSGRALMQAHMDFLGEYLVPGTLFDGVVPAMLRFLMGRQLAVEYLGVPRAGLWTWILLVFHDLFGVAMRLRESVHTHAELVQSGSALVAALQKFWQGPDQSPPFRLPESLGSPRN